MEEKEKLFLKTKNKIENFIKARNIARANKRYDIGDKIRSALNFLGYELRDTNGETFYFQNEEKEIDENQFENIISELKTLLEKELQEKEITYLKEILDLIKESQ
jgi:hypothetical protein